MKVLMPKIGFANDPGTLAQWLHEDGAAVKQGEPLYTLESDKAVEEIESPASGTLRIRAEAGSSYAIGHLLAEID